METPFRKIARTDVTSIQYVTITRSSRTDLTIDVASRSLCGLTFDPLNPSGPPRIVDRDLEQQAVDAALDAIYPFLGRVGPSDKPIVESFIRSFIDVRLGNQHVRLSCQPEPESKMWVELTQAEFFRVLSALPGS